MHPDLIISSFTCCPRYITCSSVIFLSIHVSDKTLSKDFNLLHIGTSLTLLLFASLFFSLSPSCRDSIPGGNLTMFGDAGSLIMFGDAGSLIMFGDAGSLIMFGDAGSWIPFAENGFWIGSEGREVESILYTAPAEESGSIGDTRYR